MNDRMKAELQELAVSLLSSGVKTALSARNLKAVGIDLEIPTFAPEEIAHIRSLLGMSQDVFARTIGVTKMTVSKWERGAATPGGAAAVLLATIRNYPEAIHFRFDPSRTSSTSTSSTKHAAAKHISSAVLHARAPETGKKSARKTVGKTPSKPTPAKRKALV